MALNIPLDGAKPLIDLLFPALALSDVSLAYTLLYVALFFKIFFDLLTLIASKEDPLHSKGFMVMLFVLLFLIPWILFPAIGIIFAIFIFLKNSGHLTEESLPFGILKAHHEHKSIMFYVGSAAALVIARLASAYNFDILLNGMGAGWIGAGAMLFTLVIFGFITYTSPGPISAIVFGASILALLFIKGVGTVLWFLIISEMLRSFMSMMPQKASTDLGSANRRYSGLSSQLDKTIKKDMDVMQAEFESKNPGKEMSAEVLNQYKNTTITNIVNNEEDPRAHELNELITKMQDMQKHMEELEKKLSEGKTAKAPAGEEVVAPKGLAALKFAFVNKVKNLFSKFGKKVPAGGEAPATEAAAKPEKAAKSDKKSAIAESAVEGGKVAGPWGALIGGAVGFLKARGHDKAQTKAYNKQLKAYKDSQYEQGVRTKTIWFPTFLVVLLELFVMFFGWEYFYDLTGTTWPTRLIVGLIAVGYFTFVITFAGMAGKDSRILSFFVMGQMGLSLLLVAPDFFAPIIGFLIRYVLAGIIVLLMTITAIKKFTERLGQVHGPKDIMEILSPIVIPLIIIFFLAMSGFPAGQYISNVIDLVEPELQVAQIQAQVEEQDLEGQVKELFNPEADVFEGEIDSSTGKKYGIFMEKLEELTPGYVFNPDTDSNPITGVSTYIRGDFFETEYCDERRTDPKCQIRVSCLVSGNVEDKEVIPKTVFIGDLVNSQEAIICKFVPLEPGKYTTRLFTDFRFETHVSMSVDFVEGTQLKIEEAQKKDKKTPPARSYSSPSPALLELKIIGGTPVQVFTGLATATLSDDRTLPLQIKLFNNWKNGVIKKIDKLELTIPDTLSIESCSPGELSEPVTNSQAAEDTYTIAYDVPGDGIKKVQSFFCYLKAKGSLEAVLQNLPQVPYTFGAKVTYDYQLKKIKTVPVKKAQVTI